MCEQCNKNRNFEEKSRKVHGNKYDYGNVNYVNNHTKVCIICPEHGEFWQRPADHLKGKGCPNCSRIVQSSKRSLSNDEFIEKAKKVHGDKYDYSKANYSLTNKKLTIICKKHGDFLQTPNSHLNGNGCPKCALEKTSERYVLTKEEIIKRCVKTHGGKYNYNKVTEAKAKDKIIITCPIHGDFIQQLGLHLHGNGCPKCAGTNRSNTEEFIEKARKVHGDRYDYSKTDYVNVKTKVCIICPEHGEFCQTPSNHLKGKGCPDCYGNRKLSKEEFMEKARKVHGDRYDYSKVKYINTDIPVCIICPEHGEFWQTPYHHTKRKQGCPKCRQSQLEETTSLLLNKLLIKFIHPATSKHLPWLELQHLDFYLPEYNIAIECQGEQHYFPVDFAGYGYEWAFNRYKHIIELDENKKYKCEINNVPLFYIKYNSKSIIKDILNILKKIRKK